MSRIEGKAADAAEEFDFDGYRAERFDDGLVCPHCGGRRVHRWGWVDPRRRQRRRYECLGCNRTFSDFTGTPFAYLKRIDLVHRYLDCMQASMTVRATAQRVGMDPSTSFRWRHDFLDLFRGNDETELEGEVTVNETRFL